MEIEEFKEKKEKLELDLIAMLNNRFEVFKEETGYYPKSVFVGFIDISIFGGPSDEFKISDVNCGFNIF